MTELTSKLLMKSSRTLLLKFFMSQLTCHNLIEITTSLDPVLFLSPALDEANRPTDELTFTLREDILPFSKVWMEGVSNWWTNELVTSELVIGETVTTKAPLEPTPIIITQWTRRYPVLQRLPFEPYASTKYTIKATSAWAPPLPYFQALYDALKKQDDRTIISCYYMESTQWVLGHWHNGIHTERFFPKTFWSDTLNLYVIHTLKEFQSRVLGKFWNHEKDYISYAESLEQLTSKEDIQEITEFFSTST